MRWLDGDSEMRFFSKEREVLYVKDYKYREFSLYNVRTGTIFCKLKIYDDGSYEIETLDFYNEIKDDLYTLIMRDLVSEEEYSEYSYDKWILPLFRNNKLKKLGI